MKNVLWLVLAALLAGCGQSKQMSPPSLGMDRLASDMERKRLETIKEALTDDEIAAVLDVKIAPRLPGRLAVAKLINRYGQPQLQEICSDELASWRNSAAACEGITSVEPISAVAHVGREPTLRSLRVTAARLGCELTLIYVQGDSTVQNYNDAAALYWTLLGLWAVPGTVYEHQTVVQAILMDSRTGQIFSTATGSHTAKRAAPAAYADIQRDRLAQEAPREAIAQLQASARQMFGRLGGQEVAATDGH
jgi:hypothetical protein